MDRVCEKIVGIAEKGDKTFLIEASTERSFTYSDFHNLSLAMMGMLKDKGVKKGDRVVVCLPNCVEFAGLYFACLYLGAVIVPININLNIREIGFIVKNVQAKAIIYSVSTSKYIKDVLKAELSEVCLLTGVEKRKGIKESGLDIEQLSHRGQKPIMDRSDALFVIMYTSGTTQFPKGVAHSLKSMTNNAQNFINRLGISSNDRFYNTLSMAYMAGFYNLILLPFIAGATVVIDEAFSPQKILNFWEVPLKYNVNILWLVPTILSMLMRIDRDERAKEYCEFNIRYVLIGTAPLPTQLRKDFEEKYRVKVYENYGLSETLFVTTNSPNTPVIDGSVGRPLSCSISIIGQEGERLAFGSEGEIMVKTPDLMRGYLDIETGEVKRVNLRELFPTGDIGYLDAEGNLFITGRKKDLIIKGGINISPQAIENVLTEHKAVEQVAVIGIEHPILCEDIAAVVKLKDGYSFEREKSSIIEHCRVNLSQNQQPSTFFEIEEFPLTSTGKIDKKRLKALVSEKMER